MLFTNSPVRGILVLYNIIVIIGIKVSVKGEADCESSTISGNDLSMDLIVPLPVLYSVVVILQLVCSSLSPIIEML